MLTSIYSFSSLLHVVLIKHHLYTQGLQKQQANRILEVYSLLPILHQMIDQTCIFQQQDPILLQQQHHIYGSVEVLRILHNKVYQLVQLSGPVSCARIILKLMDRDRQSQ